MEKSRMTDMTTDDRNEPTMIYVVFGSTGEYSDHNEWPIVAVASEDRAKELVAALEAKARELNIADESQISANYLDNADALDELNAFYPNAAMSCDYTGISFNYAEVPIEADAMTTERSRQ